MKKIILISCVSKKRTEKSAAKDMYISPLFEKNLAFARSQNPDAIFILSAKYGLLALDKVIEPYDQTLNTMPVAQIKAWATTVLQQLARQTDLQQDQFVFLAGEKYRKYLLSHIQHFQVPLIGLPIGKQLQYLTRVNNERNML